MWKPILSFMKMRRVRKMRTVQQSTTRTGVSQRQNPYFQREQSTSWKRFIPTFLRNWFRKDGWAIGGTVFLIILTVWYFGFYTGYFAIAQIQIDGVQYLRNEDVQAAVDEYMHSTVIGIVSHRTYWMLDANDLEQAIRDRLSSAYALEDVSVTKQYPNQLTVSMKERIPAVAWVIQNDAGQDRYFTVDRDGHVAQALSSAADAPAGFPTIRDQNHAALDVGAQVVSTEYMTFLLSMNDIFPKNTGLHIASYLFPKVECQERQYVTEQILKDEILDSVSEEFRQRKIEIQEKFQRGELTVDQSLDALEQIKQEELEKSGQGTNTNSAGALQWQAVYVPTDCDFTKVAHDLYIVTSEDSGGFTVYMDSTVDPVIQMENLNAVLQTKIADRSRVHYIDARFVDRVYYQ